MIENDTLSELDDIQILDSNTNEPLAGIGIGQTFFLKNGSSLETCLKIGHCFELFYERYQDQIKAKQVHFGKWRKTQKETLEEFIAKRNRPFDNLELMQSGAKKLEQLSLYNCFGFSAEEDSHPNHKIAVISFNLPLSVLKNSDKGSFQAMMHEWIEFLQPEHAYGGFKLITPVCSWGHQKPAFPYFQRFPGLDFDYPYFISTELYHGIKGAHWLTFLNEQHVERLGGKVLLQKNLGEGFICKAFDKGLFIQAGPTPEFGDNNNEGVPEYYGRLGKVLAPIRFKNCKTYKNYIMTPGRKTDAEETEKWFARFD